MISTLLWPLKTPIDALRRSFWWLVSLLIGGVLGYFFGEAFTSQYLGFPISLLVIYYAVWTGVHLIPESPLDKQMPTTVIFIIIDTVISGFFWGLLLTILIRLL